MPQRPPKGCNNPGCADYCIPGKSYCPEHQRLKDQQRRKQYRGRASSHQRGYGARWRKAREVFLRKHPLCQCADCKASGVRVPATVVDHITPHKGDPQLFWDESNWQALSKPCHDRKTAREDGGFGNPHRTE